MTTIDAIHKANLQLLAKEFGGVAAVAGKIGRSASQYSQWMNGLENSGTGKPRGMRASSARMIEQALGKPVGWMDAPHTDVAASPFDKNVTPSAVGSRAIPVISAIQAGSMKEMDSPYEAGDGYAVEYTDDRLSKWAFALDIEGLSMMPEFRPGDRVIIDPDLSPNPGDYVVAKNGGNEATFKKYRPRGVDAEGNEIFELVPLNDDFAIMRSDTTRLQVIGVMTEHRKRYRRGAN